MRVILAALLLVSGCRQLLGFDDPTLSDGASGDGPPHGVGHDGATPPSDGQRAPDGAPLDGPQSNIAFIQGKGGTGTPADDALSYTLSFDDPQLAGDLNLVVVSWASGSATVQITDMVGNTYTPDGPVYATAAGSMAVVIATTIAAGSNAVTATFSAAVMSPELRILEYRGLASTAPIETECLETGSGTAIASGELLTQHTHDLLVAIDLAPGPTTTAGPAFTQRVIVGGDLVEDREVELGGTYEATATQSASAVWLMRLIALEGAAQ